MNATDLKTCPSHGLHTGARCCRCDDQAREMTRRINPTTIRPAKPCTGSTTLPAIAPKTAPATVQTHGKPAKPRKAKGMNSTERKFSERLELQRMAGEIKGYAYEPITLKWGADKTGKAMRYTPDFGIFENDGSITLAEVKNAFIWYVSKVRYQGCKAQWEGHFKFTQWQWKNKTWTQID